MGLRRRAEVQVGEANIMENDRGRGQWRPELEVVFTGKFLGLMLQLRVICIFIEESQ